MADNAETSFNTTTSENNEDEVVTMVDVLNGQQELAEDVTAVLGAADDKNCTYNKGYMKRQALYACVTCAPEAKTDPTKRAGICLACSYYCHENHQLIELYTKRNFRCDCGNSKFADKKCTLEIEKSEINEENTYNHNFCGLYCQCERPYPDPEDTVQDGMIQCVICEDWYHSRHLGQETDNLPPLNGFAEMTCENCVRKHDFLLNYDGFAVTKATAENPADSSIVKVETDVDTMLDTSTLTPAKVKTENEPDTSTKTADDSVVVAAAAAAAETDKPLETNVAAEENENEKTEESNNGETSTDCKIPKIKGQISVKFWPDNWRQNLCTCQTCTDMYQEQKITYLLDTQDTVQYYEEKGKAKVLESGESEYEQGMRALSSLDRVQQVEVVSEYNDMKEKLKEYLQKFAENKKVVREEDIREFFSNMTARKKQKVDIPYYCH